MKTFYYKFQRTKILKQSKCYIVLKNTTNKNLKQPIYEEIISAICRKISYYFARIY